MDPITTIAKANPHDNGNSIHDHKICAACRENLPRNRFSKKEFRKAPSTEALCTTCRRAQTAERCRQPPPPQVKRGRVASSGITRRPNNHGYCDYVDKLFSLQCFSDIVALQAFTSAKDVSESMAAIQAATKHGVVANKDNIQCLCIGDGSTPRTAVLVSFLKKWNCISIDPMLQQVWQGRNPKNVQDLQGFGGTLEEFVRTNEKTVQVQSTKTPAPQALVLLCVHSHARFIGEATISEIRRQYHNIPTTVVSLPCCPKFRSHRDIGREPDLQYDDDCVFSACRKVEIWNFVDYKDSTTMHESTTATAPMICQDI